MRNAESPLTRQILGLVCWLGCAATITGCGSFQFRPTVDLDEAMLQDQPSANCLVMIESFRGDPRIETVTLTGPMTVDDVLKQAKATRAFRTIEVEIRRRSAESNQMIKLPVTYDTRNRRVNYEQNYAILPNDRIIVRSGEVSPFADLLGNLGK